MLLTLNINIINHIMIISWL